MSGGSRSVWKHCLQESRHSLVRAWATSRVLFPGALTRFLKSNFLAPDVINDITTPNELLSKPAPKHLASNIGRGNGIYTKGKERTALNIKLWNRGSRRTVGHSETVLFQVGCKHMTSSSETRHAKNITDLKKKKPALKRYWAGSFLD